MGDMPTQHSQQIRAMWEGKGGECCDHMFMNTRLLYKIQVTGDVIVLNWQVDGQCLIKDPMMHPVSDLYFVMPDSGGAALHGL